MITLLLWVAVALVVIPMAVVTVECLAALLPARRYATGTRRPRMAVLMPAHDEAPVIGATLHAAMAQLEAGDRLVVIADNCTDDTAAIARQCGAEVIERHDSERRGKGYALQFGMDHLRAQPAEVVVVMDADTHPAPGAVAALAETAAHLGRPVQGALLMQAPVGSAGLRQVAVTLRNLTRPMGLARMGMPCLLNGAGMAFPFRVLQGVNLGNGRLTEDRWLTVELARAGHLVLFHPARFVSQLPLSRKGVETQTERWEHGHLETMLEFGPRLAWSAIRQGRPKLLVLCLELCVPPLSLLAALWFTMMIGGFVIAWAGGTPLPLLVLFIPGFACWAAVTASTLRAEPQLASALRGAPLYIAAKLPVYFKFLFARQRRWIRTERASPGGRRSAR